MNTSVQRVVNGNISTIADTITGEAIALAAGAAGTTGITETTTAPIFDASGSMIGDHNNSSVTLGGAVTVLTTEVAYRVDQTDVTQLAAMSNGDYAIHYESGRIRYKKATTHTSAVIASYNVRYINTELLITSASVTIDNIKVFSTDLTTPNASYGLVNSSGHQYAIITDGTDFGGLLTSGSDRVANNQTQFVTGAMGYEYDGTDRWDRVRTVSALDGGTNAGTLPNFHSATSGVQTSVTLGYDNTAGANAYRAIAVSATGEIEVEVDGIYAADNTDPDNIGVIACANTTAPADTDQTIRVTGGPSSVSITSTHFFGIDTRSKLYGINGATEQAVTVTSVSATAYGFPIGIFDGNGYRAKVNLLSDELEDEEASLLFTTSAMYGFDTEGSANLKLRAVQVAADNAGVSATPNVLIDGGIYKDVLDTYDDNDAVPFHFNSEGKVITSSSGDDDGAFTVGTSYAITVMGGFYSAAGDSVDDGDSGALAMTADRHLMTQTDGYDTATDSVKVSQVNDLDGKYVGETLADLTDITSGTTAYLYSDMAGYKYIGYQLEIPAQTDTCTVTLEGTMQDDGTAAASCTYQDITNAYFGVASVAADTVWVIDTPCPYKYLRLKYVTAGGNNTADLAVYAKRMF